MNQTQKAKALEAMQHTQGWQVLLDYLRKNSTPELLPAEGLDWLIRQTFINGKCQGHKDVINYVQAMSAKAARNNDLSVTDLPEDLNILNLNDNNQ